jgi:hypothetical protein
VLQSIAVVDVGLLSEFIVAGDLMLGVGESVADTMTKSSWKTAKKVDIRHKT